MKRVEAISEYQFVSTITYVGKRLATGTFIIGAVLELVFVLISPLRNTVAPSPCIYGHLYLGRI